ncbi:hypothetical protein MKW94_021750 [Papaver nudicaule]|uniref:Uncharacterized protein n=1 Tax=Papaver nudicaule TaxID=74823 RepID=A0AA41SCB1_PAPNU|nr:hypothetical protein [Papaver nudicaule]
MDPDRPVSVLESDILILDLHSNKFQGKNLILGSSVHALDYSYNNFTSITQNISSYLLAGGATFLSFSNNQIKGEIPAYICELADLESLDLSHNNFSGPIPQCLGSIRNLAVLNLRGNNLEGVIPDNFRENSTLEKLDLNGNNQLTGTFPSRLGGMPQLRVLILRSNRLHGPWGNNASECNFPMLQIIDVSFNNFSGIISKECFSSWNGMMVAEKYPDFFDGVLGFGFEFTDVNYQETLTITIKGVEMEVVKIIDSFTTIDFSNNRFEGGIPESIGSLTLLRTLNFSRNALTGPIPSIIGNLSNLDQIRTFPSSAFEGNDGLCGFPLAKNCSSIIDSQPPNVLGSDQDGFDWILFTVTFFGFVVGASMVIGPQYFWKKGREWANERINRILCIS